MSDRTVPFASPSRRENIDFFPNTFHVTLGVYARGRTVTVVVVGNAWKKIAVRKKRKNKNKNNNALVNVNQ